MHKFILFTCLINSKFLKINSLKANSLKTNFNTNLYKPKSENQVKYLNVLNNVNHKLIITIGPAGSGKTLFACQQAITDLKYKNINKIIITRPIVSVEEEMGYLPGNINKKMDPWTRPILDIFEEFYSKSEVNKMLSNEELLICPIGLMRGRTFKGSIIIADEMQNSSPSQMKMVTTRLGENSRMIITGDLIQSDLKMVNGLSDIINKIKIYKDYNFSENIELIELDNNDIERSNTVKEILDIYNFEKPEPPPEIINKKTIFCTQIFH